MSLLSSRDDDVNYWPAMLDLVTSSLMVFLLVIFLETNLSPASLEAVITKSRQERFLSDFRKEFSSEMQSGAIAIDQKIDFLQITFSDRVLFSSGDHRLQAAGRKLLARSAGVFLRAGTSGYEQIQVEGHTDDRRLNRTEYPTSNWELSTARAISVVQFLADGQGLAPDLFSANGYSSHRPVASNRTAEGRARNRRIEIRLFFTGTLKDALPGLAQ